MRPHNQIPRGLARLAPLSDDIGGERVVFPVLRLEDGAGTDKRMRITP
jgi:hypothetical protein